MTKYFFILLLLLSETSFCQTFDGYAKLGFIAQQNNNYQEAIKEYSKAQKLEPHNIDINRRIGLMYYYLPKYDSALIYYNLVLTDNPKDTVSYYQRGFVYLDSGEYQKAVDDFQVVFDIGNKKNADASYNIAKGYMGLENYNKAIEYYKLTLSLQPNDKQSLLELGNCYSSKQNPDKELALKYYNEALSQDKDYTAVYISRGILYGQGFKDLKKAHEDLNKAISMNSKNFAAYYYNGIFYQDEKNYSKSKDMFDKVIELSPEYGEGYFRRAMAWYGIGILNMTCKDLDKAAQLGFKKAIEVKQQLCK